ncbi:3-phosphoshikimate 1-carboxyvinyltransferase [Acetobacterium woodii]|uniref:3-phosphoshikimate 1-carboxyvinyltransferase n=1 Tax=Acetobacterium woodii (strain ATCC 29683 / DSM 1030 / JCM 2381 / KCTC 1655 / WB1) TaxID=931626 RepID=H6LET3_ACEWD|nr:3-phosphoshikimate 1-carboxyvinyltransferase [Acetobacterium woodii]AFA49376.1 3-phosphoshikimate 1-carboxyvinyltransferase AroA [Acetobacterium woodii DSM 1030]
MKTIEITPQLLTGSLEIPPSKSVSHRAIIAAGLAKGESIISNVLMSLDMIATCDAMKALGASIEYHEELNKRYTLKIKGCDPLALKSETIECNESGSTLRFIIPILLLQPKPVIITGKGRLVTRPLKPYYQIFDEKGIQYEHLNKDQELPLRLEGTLTPGTYQIDGGVSSQFITGLLFMLPLLDGDSVIELTSKLESKPYLDITLNVLKAFGIEINQVDEQRFLINGNQTYTPCDYRVEGDFSQGAFWLVAGAIGETMNCYDLNLASHQGDKVIVDILKKMGGDIAIMADKLVVNKAKTHGIEIDVSQCPDLAPILAVLGSMSSGTTTIVNGERLRLKESDRLMSTADVLNKLGGNIEETTDGLVIHGVQGFTGGHVQSYNDHRIAMAVGIASICANGKIILDGADAVNKSYPHFWDDFKKSGGEWIGLNVGK